MATTEEQLAADLLSNFTDFQSIKDAGGSSAANKKVADELAHSIYTGIKNGCRLEFKGQKSAAEINAIVASEKQQGDIYLCTTAGRLDGSKPITVKANTAVIWDGTSWCEFIRFDLDGYATKSDLSSERASRIAGDSANSAAISGVTSGLQSHVADKDNPHEVTAEQVGAYTKEDVVSIYETKSDAKAKAENYGLLMRERGTNTLQFYRPALG